MPAGVPEFEAIDSKNPAEMLFRVPYLATELLPSMIPAEGTPYGETRILANSSVLLSEFRNYTYRLKRREGSYVWFYFVPHKTEAQKKIPFKTEWKSKQWKWSTVLNSLIFVPDNAFPLGTQYPIMPTLTDPGGIGQVFAPSLIERMNITPETLALSAIKVDCFTSDSPWGQNDITHLQPTEGNVAWDFNGAKGSINCLHPEIRVPARGKAYTIVLNGTTTSSEAAPIVPERIYPATNFESWEPFVIVDEVDELDTGEYYRERWTIYPPEQNEPSVV